MKRIITFALFTLIITGGYSQNHFIPAFIGAGNEHMNIVIITAKNGGIDLVAGDEIAVFDGSICCGTKTLEQPIEFSEFNSFLTIATSKADDNQTNGYITGHTISFKFWDVSQSKEITNITSEYFDQTGAPINALAFTPGSTTFVKLIGAEVINQPPVARAGNDQTVNSGTVVTFNGSGSSDPDGNALTYKWTAPSGIVLSSTTAINPTFTAPNVSSNTQYTFSLIVNDGTVNSAADQIIVTVVPNTTYALNITANNGTVTKNPNKAVYNSGEVVTLTAVPGSGYSFSSWSGSITGSTNPISVTMSGNKNITANFKNSNDNEFTTCWNIISPQRADSDVSLNPTISIDFCGENIKPGTKTDRFLTISDQSLERIEGVNFFVYKITESMINGSTLSVNIEGLKDNTTYSINIAAGAITDLAGNEFAGFADANMWIFTTGDFSVPVVTVDPITVNNVDDNVAITSNEIGVVYLAKNDIPSNIVALLTAVSQGKAVAANVLLPDIPTYVSTEGLEPGTYKAYGIDNSGKIGVASNLVIIIDKNVNTVSDIDGNEYTTITIGAQVWMGQNLKATHYNDGKLIPLVTDNTTWANLTSPAYCWYINDISYKDPYGALYNWYAVNTEKLCPTGWHVPTNDEWIELSDYLGGSIVSGGKLKETGTIHWDSPNEGATNETGFTALACGERNDDGAFSSISYFNYSAQWWQSTNYGDSPNYYALSSANSQFWGHSWYAKLGLSVRCINDYSSSGKTEFNFNKKFEIYPNPFNEHINIKNLNESNINKISLHSLSGQILKTVYNPDYTIDVQNIKKGMYFIVIETSDGQKIIKKAIKE